MSVSVRLSLEVFALLEVGRVVGADLPGQVIVAVNHQGAGVQLPGPVRNHNRLVRARGIPSIERNKGNQKNRVFVMVQKGWILIIILRNC